MEAPRTAAELGQDRCRDGAGAGELQGPDNVDLGLGPERLEGPPLPQAGVTASILQGPDLRATAGATVCTLARAGAHLVLLDD